MICSPRLKRILLLLLEAPDQTYTKIESLANDLKTSRRTIFRELENVNELLALSGVKMETRTGKGIRLTGEAANKKLLKEDLNVDDVTYVNKEERRKLLAFELLRHEQVRKLIYYANMFQVSESTISHDIESLEPLFEENGIQIKKEGKNRIEIIGSETRRRNAMTRIIHDQMSFLNNADMADHSDDKLREIFLNQNPDSIMSLLNQDILQRVLQIFSLNRHELNLDRFSQSSYIGLILHLVIAIERILKNESISENQDVLKLIQDDESFKEARMIGSELEKEFDIEIPQVETAFIAMHLQGSKVVSVKESLDHQSSHPKASSMKVQTFADDLIDGYETSIQMSLRHDEQFMQGILTHLEPALIRMENSLPIYNPLLEPLKKQYGKLFEQSQSAAKRLEEKYHLSISDEEVGFITMHVGASLERDGLKTIRRPIHLGIVCASGIGVSALLAARVQKQFQALVHVRTLSVEDIRNHHYKGSELLLSTFPLSDDSIESIQVSPLLSEKDIEKIEKRIEELQSIKKAEPEESELLYTEQLNMMIVLAKAQKDILDHLKVVVAQKDSDPDSLIWQAARQFEGNSSQIYEDLLRREKMGSVIAEDYGFVMFHAASSATKAPQFILLFPQEETFFAREYSSLHFITAAIIPLEANKYERENMSLISSSLIEEETFLHSIISRDKKRIYDHLVRLFRRYLEERLRKI